MSKRVVTTDAAPAPFQGAPYSQAIVSGDLVFVSGQLGVDPASGQLVEGGIAEQTERVMENVKAILEAAGSGLERLVKTTIFLADVDDFATVNAIYGKFMADPPPARSTIGVGALPKGALVEIEAIAHL